MKRSITLLLIFSLFSNFANSQVDKKAKDILDQVSAKTKSFSTIKSTFSYSLVNKDRNINTSQNWKLSLKGDKYRLEMGDQVILSDGKTMWKVLKMDKEVEVSNQVNNDDALNPKSVFTMYEKGFRFKYLKEEKIGAKMVHTIDLFPINPKEKDFVSIRLYIDKVANQVLKSEIKSKNGNVYTYSITTFETNKPIEDGYFTFKQSEFPGYDVNDIR